MDIGLVYDQGSDTYSSIVGYMDSNYIDDLDQKRSLISYIFIFLSCTISWKVALQSIIALSTIEIDYIVATKAVKEDMITVYCDSQISYIQLNIR